jgi:hypothetical protein
LRVRITVHPSPQILVIDLRDYKSTRWLHEAVSDCQISKSPFSETMS